MNLESRWEDWIVPQLVSSASFALTEEMQLAAGESPSIVSLSSGGFAAAWATEPGHHSIQIFDRNGVPIGEASDFSPPGFSGGSLAISLAALPNGGFIATWESSRTPTDSFGGVGVQIFDASGHTVGDPFTANTTTQGAQQQSSVTVLSSGNLVVAWTTGDDGNGDGVVAQMFSSNGAKIGGEFGVNGSTIGSQSLPQTLALPGGGFVIAWSDSWTSRISLQIYDASGQAIGGQIDCANSASGNFDIAGLGNGNFAIVFPTSSGDLAAQILTPTGSSVAEFSVNVATTGTEILPNIAALPSGEFVIGWRSPVAGAGPNFYQIGDIHAQRFDSDGAKLGEEFVIAGTPLGETAVQLASFGGDDLAAIYLRYDQSAAPTIHLQLLVSTILGSGSADILIGEEESRDAIYGYGGNDSLSGGGGNDLLEGGAGDDLLNGGAGIDIASYSDAVAAVTVSLGIAGPQDTIGAGIDSLVDIEGLAGSQFDDRLTGNASANVLSGGAGDDILDGGAGADMLVGGLGNDRYYIDNAGDRLTEAANEGDDIAFVLGTYTLEQGVSIETLYALDQASTDPLVLTGNEFGQSLYGNQGDNYLNGGQGDDYLVGLGGNDNLLGGTGADHMAGGTGNDVYYVDQAGDLITEVAGEGDNDILVATASYTLAAGVSIETMSVLQSSASINLTGNELAQSLYGNAGNNILTGGDGADYMVGGDGDDRYYVDTSDFIAEEIGGGDDWIFVATSYTLREGNEIETLVAVDQESLEQVDFSGNEFGQSLYGSQGINHLNGGGGNDFLVGLGGNDVLIGGDGNDNMDGGEGNDVFYVTEAGDAIFERDGEGDDLVVAFTSYTLTAGAYVETLAASEGAAAINLFGNARGQSVYGNAGVNVLNGGAGSDYLSGGSGSDSFDFTTALGAGNIDTIADFSVADDTIRLDDAIFTGLATGALSANAFVIGSGAQDADDRIVYNSATGALYFDADGNGAGAAIQFATLQAGLSLTAADFVVI